MSPLPWRFALALGLGGGLLEVGLRMAPRLGLSLGEVARWLLVSALLSAALSLGLAALLRRSRAPHGLLLGVTLALHAGMHLRFVYVLNERWTDVRVWGGLLLCALLGLGGGALAEAPLARHAARWSRAFVGMGLAGVILALLRQPAPAGAPRAEAPVDVARSLVLITLDTTRPDHLSPYGAANPTPAIAALAARGATFTEAFSTAPLAEPSHLAMLSGRPPHRSGVVTNGTPLGPQPALIAHALRAEGLTTAAFVSGFPLHARYGWDQAFDVYDDDFGPIGGLWRNSLLRAGEQLFLRGNTLRERPGRRTLARALAWLDDHAGERFFLWVHLFDPHGPYEAPGTDLAAAPRDGAPLALPGYWPAAHRSITSTEWLTAAYEAELREVDAQVGALTAALTAHGRRDDTALLLTADHGESLTEHDYLFEHGDNLYDPGLRVPAILVAPGRGQPGATLPCFTSTVSVARTLLSLAGVADDPALEREGDDWAALLDGAPCAATPLLATTIAGRFVEAPPIDHALRSPTWKHIAHGAADRPPTCFDLAADPDEQAPLAACPAAPAEALAGMLGSAGPIAAPALDPTTEAALRALGYLK